MIFTCTQVAPLAERDWLQLTFTSTLEDSQCSAPRRSLTRAVARYNEAAAENDYNRTHSQLAALDNTAQTYKNCLGSDVRDEALLAFQQSLAANSRKELAVLERLMQLCRFKSDRPCNDAMDVRERIERYVDVLAAQDPFDDARLREARAALRGSLAEMILELTHQEAAARIEWLVEDDARPGADDLGLRDIRSIDDLFRFDVKTPPARASSHELGGPQIFHVAQSMFLGDCFLLTALNGIAMVRPHWIKEMFSDFRHGPPDALPRVLVTFYRRDSTCTLTKQTVDVNVAPLARITRSCSPCAPWVRVLEKAYAACTEPQALATGRGLFLGGDPLCTLGHLLGPRILSSDNLRRNRAGDEADLFEFVRRHFDRTRKIVFLTSDASAGKTDRDTMRLEIAHPSQDREAVVAQIPDRAREFNYKHAYLVTSVTERNIVVRNPHGVNQQLTKREFNAYVQRVGYVELTES